MHTKPCSVYFFLKFQTTFHIFCLPNEGTDYNLMHSDKSREADDASLTANCPGGAMNSVTNNAAPQREPGVELKHI